MADDDLPWYAAVVEPRGPRRVELWRLRHPHGRIHSCALIDDTPDQRWLGGGDAAGTMSCCSGSGA
jgi:hypothetical protein